MICILVSIDLLGKFRLCSSGSYVMSFRFLCDVLQVLRFLQVLMFFRFLSEVSLVQYFDVMPTLKLLAF